MLYKFFPMCHVDVQRKIQHLEKIHEFELIASIIPIKLNEKVTIDYI